MVDRDPATLEGIAAAWQETTDALRESERRYRELVECSLGLICTHDLTGTILSINSPPPTRSAISPVTASDAICATSSRPTSATSSTTISGGFQEHGHDAGMMSVVAFDGTTRVWMYRNVLSRGADGTSYVLGHAIDVTDRVAVERSLRETIEQRETLSFLAGFSDRLSPLVTFDELVDVVQRLPVPFVADAAMVHTAGRRRIGAAGPRRARQCAARAGAGLVGGRPDPARRLGHDDHDPRRGDGGAGAVVARRPRQGRAVARLETERRLYPSPGFIIDEMARRIRLALDRIQLYREAQEANRLKDEFLSTLSHELRTPLNAIFGWARILRSRNLESSTAHAVEVIERNAEAQIRLIEEVLDVSRIVTGKMTLASEAVDLRAILRAAIDNVRPGMQGKRIRIEERIDECRRSSATDTGSSRCSGISCRTPSSSPVRAARSPSRSALCRPMSSSRSPTPALASAATCCPSSSIASVRRTRR
jgi:signal transduction histidine kinase